MFGSWFKRDKRFSAEREEAFRENKGLFNELEIHYSREQDIELNDRWQKSGHQPQSFWGLQQELKPKIVEAAKKKDTAAMDECQGLLSKYLNLAAEVLHTEFEPTLEIHVHGEDVEFNVLVCSGEDALLERNAPPQIKPVFN